MFLINNKQVGSEERERTIESVTEWLKYLCDRSNICSFQD